MKFDRPSLHNSLSNEEKPLGINYNTLHQGTPRNTLKTLCYEETPKPHVEYLLMTCYGVRFLKNGYNRPQNRPYLTAFPV